MSDWKIRIPVRDRDDELDPVTIHEACAAIGDETDRQVAHSILRDAWIHSSATTFGEVLDSLERADAGERRELLDGVRRRLGLEPTTEIDQHQATARAMRDDPPTPNLPMRDEAGQAILQCAAEGCEAVSVNYAGHVAATKVRRFWCERHADQAMPEDTDDWVAPPVRINPATGMPMMTVEAEAAEIAHYEKLAKREAEENRKRRELRPSAEEQARIDRLEREATEQLLPIGWSAVK